MADITDFYLSALNIEAAASLATLDGSDNTVPITGTDATAELDIPLSLAQSMFQYWSDATDINDIDSEDIKFRMVMPSVYAPTNALLYPENISPGDADVILNHISYYGEGALDANKPVRKDFVRYIAEEIFGTGNAADLFNNEETVRDSIVANAKTALMERLTKLVQISDIDITGISNITYASTDTVVTDASFALVADVYDAVNLATDLTNFPSKLIFRQLIGTAATASRFSTMSTMLAEEGDNWRKLPLAVADKLYFQLTVIPDAGQNNIIEPKATGGFGADSDIAPRKYLIKMNIVADGDVTGWTVPV